MSRDRLVIALLILTFVGFWVLRALFGGPEPESGAQVLDGTAQPEMQTGEESPSSPMLVEPPLGGASISPRTLLQRMYGDLENFCWEDVTVDYDIDTAQISLGFSASDTPPADLIQLFNETMFRYDEYQYKWFGSRRLLLLRQVLVDAEGGGQGPHASAIEVLRFRGSNGVEFWAFGEAAAVYPCNIFDGNDL